MHPRMTAAVGVTVIGILGVMWQAVPASQHAGWQVTDLEAGLSEWPDLAIDAAGNAVAVWTTRTSSSTADGRVRTATFTAATGTWSPAVTLSNPLDHSSNLRVRSNAAGDAVAVWRADRTSSPVEDYIVVSRYFPTTKTWHLAREIPANGYSVRAVIDQHGNITVVWVELIRVGTDYYYDPDVYAIRAVRYEAATSSWSSPVTLSGEYGIQLEVGIDGTGNVTVLWTRNGAIESVRWSAGTNSWSAVRGVSPGWVVAPQIVVDTEGNVVAVWSVFNGVQAARFSAATETWSAPIVVSAEAASTYLGGALGVDAAGNATVVYTARATAGRPAMLRSIQYLRSTDAWSGVADIAESPLSGVGGQVAVDPAGNATVVWHGQDRTLRTARRPVGGQWSADASVGGSPGIPRIASDAVGNVFLLWGKYEAPRALRAARWSAALGPPTIGRVISSSGALSIDFAAVQVLDPSYAVLNYEYSLDNGATWTARAPASASSPLLVEGLTDGDVYPIRLRAVNVAGAGLPSDTMNLTPGLAPPADLSAASVVGSSVTFAWTPPSTSVVPAGYLLEGGLTPGSVLARLPSPGTGTIFTLAAPAGVFYVRVRATIGLAESEPSPEIQVNVGVPAPPSPPTGLLGLADGDSLALAWENTFAGGAPSRIVLDVSGDRSEHLELLLTDQFSFSGVPAGTYTFALRARNAIGESGPSNAVTLTFPGTCSPPTTPANFSASNSGTTVILRWSPPASGAAPTRYVLHVSGPIAGEFPVTGLAVSGAVGQGTYTIRVASANNCGTSDPTPAKTITIP